MSQCDPTSMPYTRVAMLGVKREGFDGNETIKEQVQTFCPDAI
jgi:hypothetical protein